MRKPLDIFLNLGSCWWEGINTMDCIKYKKGYKYQLAETYNIKTDIKPSEHILTHFIDLTTNGTLIIRKGYAWDGPSGPTLDTKNFMRGALIHDALFQLMRQGHLSQKYRKFADRLLQKICREDGMNKLRAWYVYQGVHLGGKFAADPANKKQVIKAPKRCK